MIVDVLDALRSCNQSSLDPQESSPYEHTILMLDKQLHCFPWESLPCLDGRSVSRLPSLACLKERISRISSDLGDLRGETHQQGFTANAQRGAYTLNPSGDLRNTQATLEKPLSSLHAWTSSVQQAPNENDMIHHLQDQDIFLYFGHGSGGQYIRPRSIRKLDKCATTLLMGCSSGTLTEAGNFEPYGTPVNYMHAGCPALLATLWDVTDKDIDRYSVEVLKRWGLFGREDEMKPAAGRATARAKSKQKDPESSACRKEVKVSLTEAAAKSREACFLRYLNGAAPVVYGVPVFLST